MSILASLIGPATSLLDKVIEDKDEKKYVITQTSMNDDQQMPTSSSSSTKVEEKSSTMPMNVMTIQEEQEKLSNKLAKTDD